MTYAASLVLATAVWTPVRAEPDEVIEVEAHPSDIFSLAFSPDGARLASASKDRTVVLRDAATGEAVRTLKGHTADVLRLAFSPDGKTLASAGADGTVRLWDVESGECVKVIKAHGNWVAGVG